MKTLTFLTIAFLTAFPAAGVSHAQDKTGQPAPQMSAFVVAPSKTDQCTPAQLTFMLKNGTTRTLYSQQPYSGAGYSIYEKLGERGFTALPDRYMVGVSLDGGKDGFPYRWGFRGALLPGKTTTIAGQLALVEVGKYELTAKLLKGSTAVEAAGVLKAAVSVTTCKPAKPGKAPVAGSPVQPYVNGERYAAPMVPYTVDGELLLPARAFADTVGAQVYYRGDSIVLSRPGVEVVLFPGTQILYINDYQIIMPRQTYVFGGALYIPPQIIGPIFGTTLFWDPKTNMLLVTRPYGGW